jgi:tRNA nucleotidyltransferase (CCA-adding enzyme)
MTKAKYYLVGGAVRDQLLGVPSKDLDYAVEAESFEAMVEDIQSRGGEIFLAKPEFLTVRAKIPGHKVAADYVLCRTESFYEDGRRPSSVTIGTIYDDLARRDATVNAIALDEEGKLIDPYDGAGDLKLKIYKAVGDARERYSEDYLRLLRAMRFSITRGFSLHYDICLCLRDLEVISGIQKVSKERIYEELRKCFEFDTVATIKFLDNFKELKKVIFEDCGIRLLPRI